MGAPTALTTSSLGPHSYDPGILPSLGLWITAIPEDSIDFDFNDAQASLRVQNVCVFDAFSVPNSLTANHPLFGIARAHIDSLVMRWSAIKRRVHVHDLADKFSGDFIEDSATVAVTASTQPSAPPLSIGAFHGFRFVSDAAATSTTNFAQIGQMQDGVFFV